MDSKDYVRFIHDLYEFNDEEPAFNVGHFSPKNQQEHGGYKPERKKRKLLVHILAFCIMPNHYHIMLSPQREGGMTKFMRKLDIGYAKYFNQKYKRKGALFEARYKNILVENDAQFIHLPYYIHLNPLDLVSPQWRERKIQSSRKALEFLYTYRWSSFLDYVGRKNFPSVTQREQLLDFAGGEKEYERETKKWLKDITLRNIGGVLLE
ncbi:MAG: transposase [bacterium]|nr:transposase [bacterium]